MAADFTPDALEARAKREEDTYGQKELPAMLRAGAEAMRERDEAQRYGVYFAKHLAAAYYPDVPQWQPLGDPAGVLTQIDNMVAGIVKRWKAAEAKLAALQEKPHD